MPVTRIEFHAAGLYYGWPSNDIAMIDFHATEQRLVEVLREVAPSAEIVIHWDEGKDRVFGNWTHATEEADVLAEIRDLPWWDGQWWGVFKDVADVEVEADEE